MRAGLASSGGLKRKPPQWIQRWVLWARSRKKTEISRNAVMPKQEHDRGILIAAIINLHGGEDGPDAGGRPGDLAQQEGSIRSRSALLP